jgi:hypothetical protein
VNDDDEVETGDPEQMEYMLEMLARAKDSYSDRKELHQEAIQLQNCLADVLDQNEREDLYAHLFAFSAYRFADRMRKPRGSSPSGGGYY